MDFFKSCEYINPQPAVGSPPKSWYDSLNLEDNFVDSNLLRDQKLSRNEIFEIDDLNLKIISILAWGGMSRKNARYFFSCRDNWELLITEIASKKYNRSESYDRLRVLRNNGFLKGMGPAYFTKLLYFFDLGYIMDQWTSKSYNLLASNKIEIIDNTVTNNNDGEVYENYCLFVEDLSKVLNVLPYQIEEMMFSKGRNRGKWRRYVIKHT